MSLKISVRSTAPPVECGDGEFSPAVGAAQYFSTSSTSAWPGKMRLALHQPFRKPDIMEEALDRLRPPRIEQVEFHAQRLQPRIDLDQLRRHRLAQIKLRDRTWHASHSRAGSAACCSDCRPPPPATSPRRRSSFASAPAKSIRTSSRYPRLRASTSADAGTGFALRSAGVRLIGATLRQPSLNGTAPAPRRCRRR